MAPVWHVLIPLLISAASEGVVLHRYGFPLGARMLQRMSRDKNTGDIIIGATNIVYIRNSNLDAVEKVSVGPYNDSLNCPPNPEEPCDSACLPHEHNKTSAKENCDTRSLADAVIKNLIVDEENEMLIVCSNLYYGYCLKISLTDYKVKQYFRPVVSNSLVGESVGLISHSGTQNALFIGVTRDIQSGLAFYKDESHLISVRNLRNFEIAHVDSETADASFVDVKKELRDTFPVNVKYAYSYNGYSYFMIMRKVTLSSSETGTFLIRVCEGDAKLHSFIEMRLKCSLSDTQYNGFISATTTKPGNENICGGHLKF